VRLDTHIAEGTFIPPFYDSMIGKLIVHGATRDEAIQRLTIALDEFEIEGVSTTLPLLRDIVRQPDFQSNRIHTRWLEQTILPVPAAAE
jgi:acetyl-CoA carboxylase biotin carboxylase subunit